jgi:hypothetical protein
MAAKEHAMSTRITKTEKLQKEVAATSKNGTLESPKLQDLAKSIQEGHNQVLTHSRSAVAFAHKTGNYLLEAKGLVRDAGGDWSEWREKNCNFSKSQSERYIRIADRYHELLAKVADPEQLSLVEALRMLSPGKKKVSRAPLADCRVEVGSQDEYREKLIEAGGVTFGRESTEQTFINEKAGSLAKQMVAMAKKQRKDGKTPAAVAIALMKEFKKLLDDSLVVKIAEPPAVPAPALATKVEQNGISHRNGAMAAA